MKEKEATILKKQKETEEEAVTQSKSEVLELIQMQK